MGSENPLVVLIRGCLQNRSSSRPTASQIVKQIVDTLDGSLPSRLDLEKQIAREKSSNKQLQDDIKLLQEHNMALQTQVEFQVSSLERQITAKQKQLDWQLEELQKKDEQLVVLHGQLNSQEEQIKNIEEKFDQILMQVYAPYTVYIICVISIAWW